MRVSLTFVVKEAVLCKHEPAALPQHEPLTTLFEEPPLEGDFGRGGPLDHRGAQLSLAPAAAIPAPSPPVLQHTMNRGLYNTTTYTQVYLHFITLAYCGT